MSQMHIFTLVIGSNARKWSKKTKKTFDFAQGYVPNFFFSKFGRSHKVDVQE